MPTPCQGRAKRDHHRRSGNLVPARKGTTLQTQDTGRTRDVCAACRAQAAGALWTPRSPDSPTFLHRHHSCSFLSFPTQRSVRFRARNLCLNDCNSLLFPSISYLFSQCARVFFFFPFSPSKIFTNNKAGGINWGRRRQDPH